MTLIESLGSVLGAPVRIADACVGHVAGIVGDAEFTRVIGLDVLGADGARKFLPWVAATVGGGEICATSSLVLFDTHEIESYARQGALTIRSPRELASIAVESDGSIRTPVSDGSPAGTPSS